MHRTAMRGARLPATSYYDSPIPSLGKSSGKQALQGNALGVSALRWQHPYDYPGHSGDGSHGSVVRIARRPHPGESARGGPQRTWSAPDLLDVESQSQSQRRMAAGAAPGDIVAVPGELRGAGRGANRGSVSVYAERDTQHHVGVEISRAFGSESGDGADHPSA